jgi:UPF0716 protein FxsA
MFIVLALIAVPVAELYVASLVVDRYGFGPTLLALLLATALGVWVVRRAWIRRPRGADTALLLMAGLLLLFPGFITDALGLILLLPPVRAMLKVWIGQRVERQLAGLNLTMLRWDDQSGRLTPNDQPQGFAAGDVIAGEVEPDPPSSPDGETSG